MPDDLDIYDGLAAPMRLNSGRLIDLANPRPEDIDPADVAFHTAGINRWTGASRFTVAQHNVIVHRLSGEPWGLLHDAEEAFIGDASSPLKQLLGDEYRRISVRWRHAVVRRFGVPVVDVSHADHLAAQLEANYIWPELKTWVYDPALRDEAARLSPIKPWPPQKAALVWLFEARRLGLE